MRTHTSRIISSFVCGLMTVGSGVGFAEQSSFGLEEVVVTARKKAESLQDVPITMNAFDSDALDAAGVNGVEEIAQQTPGLFFQSFDETRPHIYIRGVGSRQFDAGSEGSVGIFIDEFYVGRFSGAMTGLMDIERIEVLKGPQGTLYGRNTIGGAVNVITKAPTEEFEAKVRLGAGNYDARKAQATVSGPVFGDSVLGRLSVSSNRRDGYVKNNTTGQDLMGDDTFSVRGKLAYFPTDALKLTLSGEYNNNERPGTQGEPGTGIFAARPGLTLARTDNRYSDFYNHNSEFDREVRQLMARIDYEAESLSFVSLTSWRGSSLDELRDLDSTRFDTIVQDTKEKSEAFSQEFRISSNPSDGGRLDWVAGLYYYKEDTDRLDRFPFGPDSAISAIAAAVDAGFPAAPVFVPGVETLNEDFFDDVDTTSIAAFGQFTYSLTDSLNVTVGLRYTKDEKEADIRGVTSRVGLPPIFADFEVKNEEEWDSWDPKVTFDYKIAEDVMLYLTYSQGFKSGGFQFAVFNPVSAQQVFDPEEVEVYEIGVKSTLLDRRLQLNANVFYYDYSDLQLPRVVLLPDSSFANIITNAGQSSIKGLELDLQMLVTENLMVDFGYSYLDAEYDEYEFVGGLDFSGNRMIRSPENTANLGVTYSVPIGAGELSVRADWTWTDEFFFEADEGATPFTSQDAFSLVDAFITYEIDNWSVRLWGKNLGDKEYRNSALNFGGNVIEFMAPPTTWGVEVTWEY